MNPKEIPAQSPGQLVARNPYMFSLMSFSFSSNSICLRHGLGELSLAGPWNEGERSEPSGTARPGTIRREPLCPLRLSTASRRFLLPSLFAFLAPARNPPEISAHGIPAARTSPFNPRTAFGQSVAPPEPRAPRDLNSHRCLSGDSGRKLASRRMSRSPFTAR